MTALHAVLIKGLMTTMNERLAGQILMKGLVIYCNKRFYDKFGFYTTS